jgi:hypothetical protein
MSVVAVDGFVDISIDLGERLGVDDADLDAEAREALAPILQEMVRVWREDLLSTWPVDTGRSQASWVDRWEGLVWVLRNPVEYAEYVHNAGETVPVWEFLEARSEELVADALPEIAARTAAARAVSSRVFAAQAAAFRVVSSRERTRRQLQRLDAA